MKKPGKVNIIEIGNMNLYDMDKQEWRKIKFTHIGHRWRSTKIYRCGICHVKTNEWHLGGAFGSGPRILCPGDDYKEHDELERLYKEYLKIETRIKDYKKVENPSKNILDLMSMLEAESDALKVRMKVLRDKFSKLHNLAGNPKHTEWYCPSSRVGGPKEGLA